MSEEEDEKKPVMPPPWQTVLYEIAHSDIRWSKEHGWRIVNWSILLFGALLGIQQLVSSIQFCVFLIADIFIILVASFYLIDLHSWTSDLRETTNNIEKNIPYADSVLKYRTRDVNHIKYLIIQFIIIGGAFAFTVMVQWYKYV